MLTIIRHTIPSTEDRMVNKTDYGSLPRSVYSLPEKTYIK